MGALRGCLLAALAWAAPLAAAGDAGPGPALSPSEVVEIQLRALQQNDEPGPNAGIARVWQFAHPVNRAATGPLARFKAMIQSPPYRPLIGHLGHRIEPVRIEPPVAVFEVTVTGASGRVLAYLWQLQRVDEGPLAGAWLTISVSPPIPRGEAI